MSDLESEFDPKLFPNSYTAVYCPVGGCASEEVPFVSGEMLLKHIEFDHKVHIRNSAAVIPFLDRYLSAALPYLLKNHNITEDQNNPDLCCSLHNIYPPRVSDDVDNNYIVSCTNGSSSTFNESWAQKDEQIRNQLQSERLTEILRIQQSERSSSHKKGRICLFCPLYCDNKQELFTHMYRMHNFNIGQLDNLVMVDAFLDGLEHLMQVNHQCIYCGGHFPNLQTLKKHLKNKGHMRIHPKNHIYDHHYIVNYIKAGVLYEDTPSEYSSNDVSLTSLQNLEDSCWDDLEDFVDQRTTCLLCPDTFETVDICLQHMLKVHQFDWDGLRKRAALDEYETIRLVNFMRACAAEGNCPYCVNHEKSCKSSLKHSIDGYDLPKIIITDHDYDDIRLKLEKIALESESTSMETFLYHRNEDSTLYPIVLDHNPANAIDLITHLEKHMVVIGNNVELPLPLEELWRSSTRWLFPIYEDDPLLCRLEPESD